MELTADQPWLIEVPKSEGRAVRTKWQEMQEMAQVNAQEGALVPPIVAAALLDVSKQRIHQLTTAGRFRTWRFFGGVYMSMREVRAFVDQERPTGRPPLDHSAKALWERSKKLAKK